MVSHYRCRRREHPPLNIAVTLNDEFGQSVGLVLQPVAFANPVQKYHFLAPNGAVNDAVNDAVNGTVTRSGIKHPLAHLVAYSIQVQPGTILNRGIKVSNQFENDILVQKGFAGDLLLVPSDKTFYAPINSPPAGQ